MCGVVYVGICRSLPFSKTQIKDDHSQSARLSERKVYVKKCYSKHSNHTARNKNSIVHTCSVIRKKGAVPSDREQASSILGSLRGP